MVCRGRETGIGQFASAIMTNPNCEFEANVMAFRSLCVDVADTQVFYPACFATNRSMAWRVPVACFASMHAIPACPRTILVRYSN